MRARGRGAFEPFTRAGAGRVAGEDLLIQPTPTDMAEEARRAEEARARARPREARGMRAGAAGAGKARGGALRAGEEGADLARRGAKRKGGAGRSPRGKARARRAP